MSVAPGCCRFCGCEDVHSDGFPAIDGGRRDSLSVRHGGAKTAKAGSRIARAKGRSACCTDGFPLHCRYCGETPQLRLEQDQEWTYLKGCSCGEWADWIQVEKAIVILEGVSNDRA